MMINAFNIKIVCVFYVLFLFIKPLTAQAVTDSMLVAPVMSQNMAGTDPVLRFSFQDTGPASPLSTIEPPAVVNSSYVTFNAQGELFVANRHDNFSDGSISRFKFNNDGSFSPNGTITGNGLIGANGLAFSPSGELFAANYVPGTISRFLFDINGHAIPNGKFSVGYGIQGLAFNREGELFVARDKAATNGLIHRYIFSISGNPISNGTIPAEFGLGPHGIAFSPSGELFVPDVSGFVYRFLFNSNGDALANGKIAAPMQLVFGVAFSQQGEMFLTGIVETSNVYRYLFDANGNAVPNGVMSSSEVGFGVPAVYPLALSGQPCPEGGFPKLSANITKKTGNQNARLWTISLSTESGCPAENAQIDTLVLSQTFGSICTPVITNPLSFPLGVGNIPAASQTSGTVTLDFNGCPNNARFKATIPFSSNNGGVTGSKTLNNQFR